jgi:hypothetical protein
MASGAFCFFIAIHTLLSIVFNYRMSNGHFSIAIVGIWVFVYALALVPVALHPNDIYVRAVSWCWMNSKYGDMRLWLHYFWIFIFEFGTVLIYIIVYTILQIRLKSNYYEKNSFQAQHAQNAAKLMIVYPLIYVFCTLPLASLRMISMASNSNLSFAWFCFAGAMITSNGWLDVLLYSMTRRIMLFSDEPPSDSCGIETFWVPFSGPSPQQYGTRTVCEYSGEKPLKRPGDRWRQKGDLESGNSSDLTSYASTTYDASSPSTRYSMSPKSKSDILALEVQTTISYEVTSEPIVELSDLEEARLKPSSMSPHEKSPFDFDYKPSRR